jgi:hypothetical protein
MKNAASVYDETPVYACIKTLSIFSLRPAAIRCIISIFYNFFFRQYRAAWMPGRAPVSRVDHPLDLKIPFVPAWINIYLDFIAFWIRMLSFLLRTYRRRAYPAVGEFLTAIGSLYRFAAEVYQKNFSTTNRPFYIARPRFFLVHLADPHLMCIPSLHVMVVILTYTRFAAILRSLDETDHCSANIDEMKQGALSIISAILFVKQHSVNCVAAGLYAMTCFDEELFPPQEAEAFTALLFSEPPPIPFSPEERLPQNYRLRPRAAPRTKLPAADAAEIKNHIINLYRRFLAEGKTAHNWTEPLLRFLQQSPKK